MRRARGLYAEEHAADYLRRKGYEVLERNVTLRRGELDIVAREGGDLVFVEVKARRGTGYGSSLEAGTPAKQRSLARAIKEYIYQRKLEESNIRCDVVAVALDPDGEVIDMDVVRNAIDFSEIA